MGINVARISLLCFCLMFWVEETHCSEGEKLYIPTRIEWLAQELNSTAQCDQLDELGFSIMFIPQSSRNTIIIFVQYTPYVKNAEMNNWIETTKRTIETTANGYGWGHWVKYEVRFSN